MDDYLNSSAENAAEQARHKNRMRQDWDGLIEDIIQEGVDKGLFDNLKGKGKPLQLSKNRFESGHELANAILRDNDLPPSWIMERNDILAQRDALREDIRRKWRWHKENFTAVSAAEKGHYTIRWDDYCLVQEAKIEALNKRIVSYNLKRPLENMEIFKLNLAAELERAGARRWLR